MNNKKSLFKKTKPYLFILPSMLFFGVFSIFPLIYIVVLSFFKRSVIGEMSFVGLENFTKLFQNNAFAGIIKNTVVYMLFVVITTMICSILIALLLQKKTKFNSFMQSVIFAPYVISLVSIVFVWMWMMDTDYGLFNYILSLFGASGQAWLSNPDLTIYSVAIVSVWKSLGYNAIIIIVALNSIPTYLFEAAKLDNASAIKTFFKITLPMISPTLFFLALINIIGALKSFETIKIMTAGKFDTTTLVYFVYQNAREYFDFGLAAAAGTILMALIGVLTIFYFNILSKKVHYR